mgnify:CR=1 FL=1
MPFAKFWVCILIRTKSLWCSQDIFCICIDKQEEESHYKRFYKNIGIQFPWNMNFYQIMKEYPNVFGKPYVYYINKKQTSYSDFINMISYVSQPFAYMMQKLNIKRNRLNELAFQQISFKIPVFIFCC